MDKTGHEVEPDQDGLLPWQQRAVALWNEGRLQKEIATDVGRSLRTVNRFLRSEVGLKLSQRLRGIQWDQLTNECAQSALLLLNRVSELMQSADEHAAIRACTLMRQLIRDSLEFDLGARLTEVENRLLETNAR